MACNLQYVSRANLQHCITYEPGHIISYKIACAPMIASDQPVHPPEDALDYWFITKTRLFKYIENFTSKNWKISDKNSNTVQISAQNTDCGYSLEPPQRGGSNEYPQSMFLSRNKKNNVHPCKPQFYCIEVWFKAIKII